MRARCQAPRATITGGALDGGHGAMRVCPSYATSLIRDLSDQPAPFVNIELHQALVAHFQQEGLARLLIRNIGAFHDLIDLERLLAKRAQDFFSFIEHYWTPEISTRAKSLTIRKLVFRNDALDIVGFALDAVSETPIGLDRHALNDGVDHRRLGFSTPLRALALVEHVFIQLVGI
jgi:hypothetical protein